MSSPGTGKPAGYRFPSDRLSEADFERLDRVRAEIVDRARRTVDPEGTGLDVMMMASDDGSFFGPTEDMLEDWRDRIIDVISITGRRVSLAILAAGFAVAGAALTRDGAVSGYGQASMVAAGAFALWAVAANVFGPRARR
jgi:hypothetical protein